MTAEQRRHRRYPVALTAELTVGTEAVAVATQNVSEGGVSFALPSPLRQGTRVLLTLILTQDGIEDPFRRPFDVPGVVAWCKPAEGGAHLVGLEFEAMDDPRRARLHRFIAALG